MGGLFKEGDRKVPVFTFQVGGSLGKEAKFSDRLLGRVRAEDLAPAVGNMIQYYIDNRASDREVFYQFERRVGKEPFQAILDQYKL